MRKNVCARKQKCAVTSLVLVGWSQKKAITSKARVIKCGRPLVNTVSTQSSPTTDGINNVAWSLEFQRLYKCKKESHGDEFY